MNQYRAVLIDISGTLITDNTIIPKSIEALKYLRTNKLNKIKFVTNTTKESQRRLYERLKNLGFSIEFNEIFSSLSAARSLIRDHSYRPKLLLENEALEDFRDIETNNPNVVVIGLAPSLFNYQELNEAFNLLVNGAKLIAIHKARYYRTKDILALGPGPFVEALQYAADVKAEVVGKPEASFFRAAIDSFGVPIKESIMIGDDVHDDILGAINAGFRGILVKTGKYREDDELMIGESSRICVNCFADAVEFLMDS